MLIRKLTENWRMYLLIFLALLTLAIWSIYLKEPDDDLHIYTLDVGQGDAILIQKQNYQILIDGGPDNSVIEQLAKVMPVEDREIELIILTHPHADHVTGLVEIQNRYKIMKIEYSAIDYESNIYAEFLDQIKKQKIEAEIPKTGDIEDVFDASPKGTSPKGKITFLWPGKNADVYKDNLNNTSEVIRFDYGSFSALFPGDCEVECWQGILKDGGKTISDLTLLKVAHHGSNNGTTAAILGVIKPKIAVISLGQKNKFGFPHKETIELLQKIGADIYRTDLFGTINISTDGNQWKVTN